MKFIRSAMLLLFTHLFMSFLNASTLNPLFRYTSLQSHNNSTNPSTTSNLNVQSKPRPNYFSMVRNTGSHTTSQTKSISSSESNKTSITSSDSLGSSTSSSNFNTIDDDELLFALENSLKMIECTSDDIKNLGWRLVQQTDDFLLYKRRSRPKNEGPYEYLMTGEFTDVSPRSWLQCQVNKALRCLWDDTMKTMSVLSSATTSTPAVITSSSSSAQEESSASEESAGASGGGGGVGISENPADNQQDVIYYRTKWPWPLKDRDYTLCRRFAFFPESDALVFVSRSVEVPDTPPIKDVVRVDNYRCHSAFVSTAASSVSKIKSKKADNSSGNIVISGIDRSNPHVKNMIPLAASMTTANGANTAASFAGTNTKSNTPLTATTTSSKAHATVNSASSAISIPVHHRDHHDDDTQSFTSHTQPTTTRRHPTRRNQIKSWQSPTSTIMNIATPSIHNSNHDDDDNEVNIHDIPGEFKKQIHKFENWSNKLKADLSYKLSHMMDGSSGSNAGGNHAKGNHKEIKKKKAIPEVESIDKPGVRFISFFCDDNRVPLPRVVVDALSTQAERIAAKGISKLHLVAKDHTPVHHSPVVTATSVTDATATTTAPKDKVTSTAPSTKSSIPSKESKETADDIPSSSISSEDAAAAVI